MITRWAIRRGLRAQAWVWLLAVAVGCEGGVTEPSPDPGAAATAGWNATLGELLSRHDWTPPGAAREIALLTVAQLEALAALEEVGLSGEALAVAENAALEAASAGVLSALYPAEQPTIDQQAQVLRLARGNAAADAAAAIGRSAGTAAASRMVERAASDGAGAEWPGSVPTGEGIWFSSQDPPGPPLHPMAGAMRPWIMAAASNLDPGPPPAFGSPAFVEALAEVREISDHRTAEQTRIARHWEYGPGTPSPAGQWNEIALELITIHRMDERDAVRVLAVLNMAMADAGIACWAAKYEYWLLRPSQADPAITNVVGLPNFPAYPSGHSCFSGAADGVLRAFFPAERTSITRQAEENGLSRIYGGVHYSFDNSAGLAIGRAVAALALASPDLVP